MMPTFHYPSSNLSTPGSSKRPTSNLFDHPSTTPAGPPPSSAKSFTPAGIPSSLFGAASQSQNKPPPSFSFGNGKQFQTNTQTTKVKLNDLPVANEEEEDEDAAGEDDMEAEYPELPGDNGEFDFDEAYDWNDHRESTRHPTAGTQLRSSNRAVTDDQTNLSTSLIKGNETALAAAARNLVKIMGNPVLDESDDLILQTEHQVNKLYNEHVSPREQEEVLEKALKTVPAALSRVWERCSNEIEHSTDEERGEAIGPADQDPALYKASYVGGLLLLLNHPPARIIQPPQQFRSSMGNQAIAIATIEAYPKALVDWLDHNHNPYRSATPRLFKMQPNPTANQNFWDLVLAGTLRGQIGDVVNLLANADFSFAASAKEDGSATKGYKDHQLQVVSFVVGRAAAKLQACPALRSGDWNVTGSTWAGWRVEIEEELAELIRTAEGEERAAEFRSSFDAENFGISTRSQPLSMSTRRAQSKVPWTIYEGLKTLYNILLGSFVDIVNSAQDWLEAVLSLAIWWTGSDSEELGLSTAALRQSRQRRSQTRMVDIDTVKAYRQRLLEAFDAVTQPGDFQIDQHNAVEVAIASILEGSIQDTLTIMRAWSVPITAAIMEIGTEAQWYESIHAERVPDMFDESDLMVLSYTPSEQPVSKDSVLVEYAKMLLERPPLQHGGQQIEGWELAIELVGRIDNLNLAVKTAQEIIKSIAVTDDHRADRVIGICKQFDLHKEAVEVAEKYGDTIPETTGSYGTALIYYARAHNTRKVKDVLDLLISYCLVQSVSFPSKDKLDHHLDGLLHRPQELLPELASVDQEAAELLSAQFSGYATIRKYYDIRDGLNNHHYRSLQARRKAAAKALLTTVQSAADNIQGGLYDSEHAAVIPVDGLLALLGEASLFVNQTPRILALPDLLVLLRVIEDLNAVHSRIKAQCAEFFSSTLAAAHGVAQPDARELMKKSISDLTASTAFSQSTGFSLLGASMMGSGIGSSYADVAVSGASGTKDNHKRGWDWRQDYRRDAAPGKLLRKLRLGLAEEVGVAWIEDLI